MEPCELGAYPDRYTDSLHSEFKASHGYTARPPSQSEKMRREGRRERQRGGEINKLIDFRA